MWVRAFGFDEKGRGTAARKENEAAEITATCLMSSCSGRKEGIDVIIKSEDARLKAG